MGIAACWTFPFSRPNFDIFAKKTEFELCKWSFSLPPLHGSVFFEKKETRETEILRRFFFWEGGEDELAPEEYICICMQLLILHWVSTAPKVDSSFTEGEGGGGCCYFICFSFSSTHFLKVEEEREPNCDIFSLILGKDAYFKTCKSMLSRSFRKVKKDPSFFFVSPI